MIAAFHTKLAVVAVIISNAVGGVLQSRQLTLP